MKMEGGAAPAADLVPCLKQDRPIAMPSRWSPSRRPPRHPVRTVPKRHQSPNFLNGSADPVSWKLVTITAADDLGCVRTGMTYDKEYSTSAGFFEKPRRLQYFEGPNEPAVADYLEMNPRIIDFQFQPLDLTFLRADGRLIHKYPDVAIEYDDHTVRFGEIKSDDNWFKAPGVRRPLERISAALEERELSPLLKIRGVSFRSDGTLEAHARAMDARLTIFDHNADAHAVRSVVIACGGTAPYAAVVSALAGNKAAAIDKLYAMLLRRIVSFDLETSPVETTPVTLPRRVTPYALREVLARFTRKAA